MFHFICNTLLHPRNSYNFTPHNPSSMVVSLSLIRCFSSDSADNPHYFTVSYLTKTCGLSPKSALSVSKSVQFESPDKPDSVLSCFQKFGFSKTQISEMIRKFPKMLRCHPEKTISHKVDFFCSKGASTPDLVRIFTVNPWILKISLGNRLVPTFNILVEMFQSEDRAMEVVKRNPQFSCNHPEACLIPNINTLRENGVPESKNLWLIHKHWLCFDTNPVGFGKIVEEVKEMGFNPLQSHFVVAVIVLTTVTKSKWDKKVEVFKRWGWSDKDIITAFRKSPWCMAISEDKVMAVMDFYVNKLGLESSVVLNRPVLLEFSLKNRLIPRGAVVQYLLSKGLAKLDSRITNMFECTEKCFLEKYVNGFEEEPPHLIKLYNEKLNEVISEVKS